MSEHLIQVKDLKKHYNKGAIKALDGVTVDIDKGDVMVVIGPSGSGTWQYSAADFTSCRDSSGLAQMVSATWQITSFLASMAAMAACFFASIKSFSFV